MSYFAEVYKGWVRFVGSGSVVPTMNPVLLRVVDCTASVAATGSFGLGWSFEPSSNTFHSPSVAASTVQYQNATGDVIVGAPPPDPTIPPAPNPGP